MAKILFCINSFSLGGVERRLSQLILGLGEQRKHEMFCIINKNGRFINPLIHNYIKIYVVKLCNDNILNETLYANVINKITPDIIHCWTMRQCEIINNLNEEVLGHSVYICGAVNSAYVYEENSNHRRIIDTCINKSDIIVSNSKSGLIAKNIPPEKSIVINNGYDFHKTSSKDLRSTDYKLFDLLCKYEYIVFMACRICPEKDINMFLDIAKLFHYDNRFLFLLAGDGPSCNESFLQIINNTLNVIFLGYRSDVENIIEVSDFCLLCSNPPHEEGISNFIMESMAHRKVVIATIGGGTNEIIKHNENGILVKPHDAFQASQHIIHLAQNINARIRLGLNAYETIKSTYNFSDKLDQYNALYDYVTNNKKHIFQACRN